MPDLVAISNAAADAAGIPRLLLLACACAESSLRTDARRPTDLADDARYWPDVSGGPWQQTVRYDPDYRGGDAFPGPAEIARVLALQYDPVRSARIAATNLARKFKDGTESDDDDNLIRDLFEYNWPAGHERPFTPEHEANYRRGLREARVILGMTAMPPTDAATLAYNPAQPAEIQVQDWACSIRTATWVLKSLGVATDAGALQDEMVPTYVTPQKGLLDARGYGLAVALRAHLPPDWQNRVHVLESLGWDNLKALVGRGPLALGGRTFGPAGHWVGVRRGNADGSLAIMNPAPGYTGVGDTLTRQQFDARSPFSAVWVNADPAAVVVPPVPVDDLAALRFELADKTARLDAEVSKLGYISGDVAAAWDRVAEAASAIASTLRQMRPPAA